MAREGDRRGDCRGGAGGSARADGLDGAGLFALPPEHHHLAGSAEAVPEETSSGASPSFFIRKLIPALLHLQHRITPVPHGWTGLELRFGGSL
jgi:hypothetical protein